MQKFILTFVFVLLIGTCIAQEKQWESLKINNELEISFPEKYTSKLNKDGKTLYRCKLADSTAILSFIEVDLSVSGLSAQEMDEQAKTDKFWDGYVPALVEQVPKAKLIKFERKDVDNTSGVLITYKIDNDVLHQLVLVKGLTNYIIVFRSRNKKGDDKLKDQFFGSIKIKQ